MRSEFGCDLDFQNGHFRYTHNAKKLAEMLKHQPYDPVKLFTDRVEYAAKFPEFAKMTELESASQSFIVFHSLDSIFILLALFVSTLITVVCLLTKLSVLFVQINKVKKH